MVELKDRQPIEVEIAQLTDNVLFDIARNESAQREWRKAAVKLLLKREARQASHPDLFHFVDEVKREQAAEGEVKALVEAQIEEPLDAS